MSDDETKQLLREIRDLQKAHFDRYLQFTQEVLDSQRKAEKAARDREPIDNAYAAEQAAFQQEMRDQARRNSRAAFVTSIVLILVLGAIASTFFLGEIIRAFLPLP